MALRVTTFEFHLSDAIERVLYALDLSFNSGWEALRLAEA